MNLFIVIMVLIIIALIILGFVSFRLAKRLYGLSQGKNGSLEEVINSNNKSLQRLKKIIQQQQTRLDALEEDAQYNIQHIGVERFNPFKETGGSQSFAVALVDKKGSGVILSSLYARERVNVFAKPITDGSSDYTLSPEEQQALEKTIRS